MKRLRVKMITPPVKIKFKRIYRSNEYHRLRYWWLHELRQLRAKRRVSGTASTKDIKIIQRELARLRKTYEGQPHRD